MSVSLTVAVAAADFVVSCGEFGFHAFAAVTVAVVVVVVVTAVAFAAVIVAVVAFCRVLGLNCCCGGCCAMGVAI